MTVPPPTDLQCLAFLEGFLTEARLAKIESVLEHRTAHVRVVLEDIFQPHNASAAMRSCEGFGVQHLDIIENRYAYAPNNEVSMGAGKWVSWHRHRAPDVDSTRACLTSLKARGYRIVATALRDDAIPLEDLSIDQPTALCFGTEEDGLSETALELADAVVRIPMFGFTQSFNLSVAVSIMLHTLCGRLRRSELAWGLSEEEKNALRWDWVCRSLKNPEALVRRFQQERS